MNDQRWAQILSELQFSFTKSSGPGGQHVNTTDTKVELRWNVKESSTLTDAQKERILEKLKNKLVQDSTLRLTHGHSRSQERNKKACLNRLRFLLEETLKPEKVRKKTKPSQAARKKRMESKRKQSEKKSRRIKIDSFG